MKWLRWLLVSVTIVVLILGLAAALGGWLGGYLAGLAGIFLVGLAVAWTPIKYWAARHHPWWSFWALLRENSFFAITKGDSIVRYVANPTDQSVRKRLESLIEHGQEPISLLPPGESLVFVGPFWIYGLKGWAWSEWLEFIDGQTKHAMTFDIQKKTLPQQLKPEQRDALEQRVNEARHNRTPISPSEAERLLDVPYLLSKDNIALGVPMEVHFRIIYPRLSFTDGKFPLDKIRSVVINALFKTLRLLDFLGHDPESNSRVSNPDLKANVQKFLNIYLGLGDDDGNILLPQEELGKDILATFGIELVRVLVGDVQETSKEITEAMQRKAIAETQRDADVVAADAKAKVAIREAEGKKAATVLVAEGDAAATVKRATGDLAAGRVLAKRDRITLAERIKGISPNGEVTPAAVAAYLEYYGIHVYGQNVQQSGRVIITDMSRSKLGGLSAELLALVEAFKGDTAKMAEALRHDSPGSETPTG